MYLFYDSDVKFAHRDLVVRKWSICLIHPYAVNFRLKKKRKSVTNRKIFFYRGLVFGLPLNFFDLISLKWLNIKFN